MYFAEHKFLGDTISLSDDRQLPSSELGAIPTSWKLENGLVVTYGDINGFAGDYFGLEKPISSEFDINQMKDKFQLWFNLLGLGGGKAKAEAIRQELESTNDEADKALRSGSVTASTDLATLYKNNPLDIWHLDTVTKTPKWANGASFMQLLETNVDHFAAEARQTYNAGHALALDWATKGDLTKALSINGFADHFLEDSFAVGHIRVPRGEIAKVAKQDATTRATYSKLVNASANVSIRTNLI
jgi:hypothetical protein